MAIRIKRPKHSGRSFVKLRLRRNKDDDIQEILDALEGDISEYLRDAIRQKKAQGTNMETILHEIRELKQLLEQQAE